MSVFFHKPARMPLFYFFGAVGKKLFHRIFSLIERGAKTSDGIFRPLLRFPRFARHNRFAAKEISDEVSRGRKPRRNESASYHFSRQIFFLRFANIPLLKTQKPLQAGRHHRESAKSSRFRSNSRERESGKKTVAILNARIARTKVNAPFVQFSLSVFNARAQESESLCF